MSLQENFDKAAAEVKAFSKRPDDSVLLQLYGLYKQATTGDNTTGTRSADRAFGRFILLESNLGPIAEAPWAIQFEAKAKWDAWNANKGTCIYICAHIERLDGHTNAHVQL